jgi:hyperosmotically inducible protein
MQNIFWSQALIATTFAVTACSTPSDRTDRPTSSLQPSEARSDRFDNLDTRSNSTSSPAYMGAEQSRLSPDISSRQDLDQESSAMARPTTAPVGVSAEPESAQTTKTVKTTTKKVIKKTKPAAPAATPSTELASPSPSPTRSGTSSDQAAEKGTAESTMTRDARTGSSTDYFEAAEKPQLSGGTGPSDTGPSDTGPSDTGPSDTGPSDTGPSEKSEASEAIKSTEPGMGLMAAPTAQQTARTQKETQLLQKIRREITANRDLSLNAHNVKIISQSGQIFLRGPVDNANEKMKVEEIAKRLAGNTTVINQITIDTRSGTSTEDQQLQQQQKEQESP